MHELSIAINIIEIAEEEVHKANAKEVNEIEIEIGVLSGVIVEALEFALETAIKNTVLEQSIVRIIKISAKARCTNCGMEFEIDDYFSPCPKCKNLFSDIIDGNQLTIKKMIVS
jgi:hydrogenase nickel incorporation protein HypA/HybF